MAALRSRQSNVAQFNQLSIADDHKEMLRLVRIGDVSGLQKLMRAHSEQTKRSYLDVLDRPEFQTDAKVSEQR